ncbi:Jacalin-related lectin 22 [Cardamine amara subsp. amara]|uniref:Jacalin-related lectin 22 n=1 Tax=Cardamine amara subsp. amara TaxID=228776 RepID=A0ABD1C1X6_CARAN
MSQKVGPFGGRNGNPFDDGVYDVVRKLTVGENEDGVSYIKIEYEKDGKIVTKEHGNNKTHTLKEFQLKYPDEYITSIQGTHATVVRFATVIVKTLIFKTSHGRTSPMFGKSSNVKNDFDVIGKDGAKLIGFHGRAGDLIESIGAYFYAGVSSPPIKQLEIIGGSGLSWDDGLYDGVTKVFVGVDDSGTYVNHVKVEYVKGGTLIQHSHGNLRKAPTEFALDYPNEHVTSLEGTYDDRGNLRSLTIKTSKGRVSPSFGKVIGTKFILEEKGFMLVGLRGRYIDGLTALGGNFGPLPLMPPSSKKLDAKGGNGGAVWDDGAYEDVRKVYVGQGDSGVSFVKFEYANGKELVIGDGHGKMSLLGTEEFELEFPNEYIISVEGTYDKVFGIAAEVVAMLRFKTNKRTSPPFGLDAGEAFVLEEKDHKIVGFHGKAGEFVHQVGVYVSPISKS